MSTGGFSNFSLTDWRFHQKPLVKDLNGYLICILCGGYYVDATTIIECIHSFCRSCIVKYLQTHKFCPICDVQVNKTKPSLSLRRDHTLQSLIYKIIPGLYTSELERRKTCQLENVKTELQSDEEDTFHYYSPLDLVSICLEYCEEYSCHMNELKLQGSNTSTENQEENKIIHKKYLQCPAAVTIGHLQKFLRLKYSLAENQTVEILYQNQQLPSEFSLIDVAYTYSWDRKSAMILGYCILTPALVRILPSFKEKFEDENTTDDSTPPTNISGDSKTSKKHVSSKSQSDLRMGLKRKLESKFEEKIRRYLKMSTNSENEGEPVKRLPFPKEGDKSTKPNVICFQEETQNEPEKIDEYKKSMGDCFLEKASRKPNDIDKISKPKKICLEKPEEIDKIVIPKEICHEEPPKKYEKIEKRTSKEIRPEESQKECEETSSVPIKRRKPGRPPRKCNKSKVPCRAITETKNNSKCNDRNNNENIKNIENDKNDEKVKSDEILGNEKHRMVTDENNEERNIHEAGMKTKTDCKDDGEKVLLESLDTALCDEAKLKINDQTLKVEKCLKSDEIENTDDYSRYEKDIEEIVEESMDDDENYKHSLSEEDTSQDDRDRKLVIDIDFDSSKLDEEETSAVKYKRKSKKSKRHHHHHHHHRHHDKKKPPPATILHSPDTDIMKLKVKLNPIQIEDSKSRKQSRREKRKHNAVLETSSNSSISSECSPGGHSSRTDEDSMNSHLSEFSVDSADTSSSKEDPLVSEILPPVISKPNVEEKAIIPLKQDTPSGITEQNNVEMKDSVESTQDRPSININNKDAQMPSKKDSPTGIRPTSDKNSHLTVGENEVPAKKLRRISIPDLLKAPSSITVSKITAAEKLKMEQEKLQKNNFAESDSNRPSLEIVLVNKLAVPGSSSSSNGTNNISYSVASSGYNSSSNVNNTGNSNKSLVSAVNDTFNKNTTKSASNKQIRPPPPAIPIPLFHLQKLKAAANTERQPALTITPQLHRVNASQQNKSNGVKISKVSPNKAVNQNGVTSPNISTSPTQKGTNSQEIDSALDLSGGSSRKDLITPQRKSNTPPVSYSPSTYIQQSPEQRLKNIKSTHNDSRLNSFSIPSSPPKTATNYVDLRLSSPSYSPVRSLTSLSDSLHANGTNNQRNAKQQRLPSNLLSNGKVPRGITPSNSIISSLKMQSFTTGNGKARPSIPKLNEIKIGPKSTNSEPTKPGPNQTIRNIPNPSVLLHRHQNINNVIAATITPNISNGGVKTSESFVRFSPSISLIS